MEVLHSEAWGWLPAERESEAQVNFDRVSLPGQVEGRAKGRLDSGIRLSFVRSELQEPATLSPLEQGVLVPIESKERIRRTSICICIPPLKHKGNFFS